MKKFFSLLLMIAILAFMLLSPAIIADGVNKNIFNIKKEKQSAEYRGTISLWHVVSFKTGQGSGYSMLKLRSARFEENTPYVFVELSGMTPEEAEKRLAEGERPDIISYPYGFADTGDFAAAEKNKDVAEPLAFIQHNTYPYMFDSYALLVNSEIFYQYGISLPFGELMSEEAFYAAVNNIEGEKIRPLSLSGTKGIRPAEALNYLRLSDETAGITLNCEKSEINNFEYGMDVFLNGESAMHICPYSEYKSILDDKRAGAMTIECYPASDYTDLIQCIGVYKCEDAAKEEMCLRLASSLLGKGFQKQLESVEMFPVIYLEDIYADNYARKTQYERLMSSGVYKIEE